MKPFLSVSWYTYIMQNHDYTRRISEIHYTFTHIQLL